MLTVVMPGHSIPPHVDEQPEAWLARIHVPLTTNDESRFIVGGEHHHMDIGSAYLVNTTVEHAVRNDGGTPRIHLMWDLLSA
jgi:aspartyl/asparaginyl beta-hydroxylase (cupin superfamily)